MRRLLYIMLLLVATIGCTTDAERAKMRSDLDSINVRNRAGLPFTVSDVEPFVKYFTSHGTPQDRLLAYYLLGRAYYDQGEAPMSLQCYYDAIDCADTASADCDYAQLSRVYGQMADIYYDQGLYREGLLHDQLSTKSAWKGGDTLAALRSYEQEGIAYSMLGQADSFMIVIKEVALEYEQCGYPVEATIALATIIGSLIDRGEYQEAKRYMDRFESQSGRFDSLGNIEAGREIYYNFKGQYYLHINVMDSAEYYFRKEIRDGRDYGNQHAGARGLAELYQRLHQPDSTAKYSQYAYVMNDSVHAITKAQEIERVKAVYDYTRNQKIAHRESERAAVANKRLLVSLLVILMITLLTSWLYIARKELLINLEKTVAELGQIDAENAELRQDMSANQQQIAENEKRIRQLEQKLGRYGKLVYFGAAKAENDLILSSNYQKMKEIARKGEKLQGNDLEMAHQLVNEYFPGCYDFLVYTLKINSVEQQVSLLLRLHFKAGEIANMLNVTPPYISRVCSETMEKLFKKKGSSKELAKELGKLI